MITNDELVLMARAICQGSLRPTYCQKVETFYPHLWVLEAMRQAYQRGRDDAASLGVEQLRTHFDELMTHHADAVSDLGNRLHRQLEQREDLIDGTRSVDPPCHKCGHGLVKQDTLQPVHWDRFSIGWNSPAQPRGDLPLPIERNGAYVVDIPAGQEDIAKRAADAYRAQIKQTDDDRDAAIAKCGTFIAQQSGVNVEVLREIVAKLDAKEKP